MGIYTLFVKKILYRTNTFSVTTFMSSFPHIEGLDVAGQKVLVRVDFNLPLNKSTGEITDDTRIIKALPTLQYLLKEGASLILMSHLGRPKGQKDDFLSMKKVADKLKEHLPDNNISFSPEAVGEEALKAAESLSRSDILVLENVRFYPEETSKDKSEREKFAKQLTALADIYVDDAFGSCHRAHASIVECAEILPAYAGFLLKKEIEMLEKILNNPERPFVAIIGGSKVSSKIAVLENLIEKVDDILIGGAMAYTFLKSRLIDVGNSMIEKEYLSKAFQIIDKASLRQTGFHLPEDHIVADEFSEKAKTKTVPKQIPDGFMGMDIGPKTISKYTKIIKNAKTILWNGPMGVFEMDNFAKGTESIAKSMAKVKGMTIVGGGDSVFAVKKTGVEDKMQHVSTGGGATLEYLEGKKLPGVEVLMNRSE